MQNDHTLRTAGRLLVLKRATQPISEEIDFLTEELRQVVAENHNQRLELNIPNLGTVIAAAASTRRLRGVEDVLILSNWLKLDEGERGRLKKHQVVKTAEIYTQARKSAVSVHLSQLALGRGVGWNAAGQAANVLRL
jgi:hypothetical protein